MGFHIVKKENCPWWQRLILYVSAVLIALGLGAVVLLFMGVDPVEYYYQMFTMGTVGNRIAYKTFMNPKNVKLFSTHGVMSETEMHSREEIYFENYSKIVNIEALTMIVMATRDYIPAVENYIAEIADVAIKKKAVLANVPCRIETELIRRLSDLNTKAYNAVEALKAIETEAASISDAKERAECYCTKVLPAMNALRAAIDEMETLTASKSWPVPTYGDMMFRV